MIKIKIVSPVVGTDGHPLPLTMMYQERYNITSVVFLFKMHNMNWNMRKYQGNPNWKIFYKISQDNERQRKMEELSQTGRDTTTISNDPGHLQNS